MDERIFNNRYRIERRVGEGGMAVVYLGMDMLLRRRVAVKVLRDLYARDEDFVRRFYSEAQNAARLSHPNIVNIYDVGEWEGEYYIVMEYVDGETLSALIAADGKIPEPVAIDYATQITSGLAYAHRQGLLHRDIKPANILVTKDDVVKLSDFGIARAVSQHTMTQPGMVMGSVYYISPEQAQGHDVDATSDLYSLGVVLYQMVIGKLPYTGDSPVTVALKHVAEPVPAIEPDVAGISPALAQIITRLMQKHPGDRYRSASEVATALREARERPMVMQGAPGSASDAPTTVIPRVSAPQPPPRRSAAPDRPVTVAANGTSSAVVSTGSDGSQSALRIAALAALLILAIALGYVFLGRRTPLIGPHANVALANYTGTSATRAADELTGAGLHVKVTNVASSTILQGRVVKQSPAAGTNVPANSTVELFVSSGLPFVAIPDVRGAAANDATSRLGSLHLKVRQLGRYSSSVAAGAVIDQRPAAGKHVRQESEVTLVVSKGEETAVVPDLVSANLAQATQQLKALHLKIAVAQRAPSDTIPADAIESQDPKAGSRVAVGSSVSVYVSSGVPSVAVPDVGSKNATDAGNALTQAGLTPNVTYSVQPNDATGTVMRQDPPPGTKVRKGSRVAVTIAVAGAIPDVSGMSLDDAKAALQNAGYAVGNVTETQEGDEGKVVRTEPEANTQLQPGESVVIYYNGQVPAGK